MRVLGAVVLAGAFYGLIRVVGAADAADVMGYDLATGVAVVALGAWAFVIAARIRRGQPWTAVRVALWFVAVAVAGFVFFVFVIFTVSPDVGS